MPLRREHIPALPMAGSAPQGEKCGAQTHQAGHKHQAGAITALVPQGAQARCSAHPGLRNHPDSQLKALLTHLCSHSTLDLTSSSRLDFFSFSNLFNQTPSCSSPFSFGYSLFFSISSFPCVRKGKVNSPLAPHLCAWYLR